MLGVASALIALICVIWVATRPLRSERARAGQVQLTVLHWGDKNEDAIVAGLCADFESLPENRDIRILRINLGQASAVATKLQTMMAAGDPPDVFYLEAERVADFASKGLLADIDQFIAQDAAGPPGDRVDLSDFFTAVVNCFRFDGRQVGRGTLVGLPKDFTTVGFYYNKDLFRRAGVPFPSKEGWTWEEFIEAARKIGKLPGCYGADFVTWEAMVRVYLFTYGLDFISPGFAQFHFDDPKLIAALEQLRSWFHDEERTLLSAKTQLETGQEPFLSGNIGLAGPFGRWKVPTYRLIENFDWDFAPLPQAKGHPPSNGVFTVAWAMSNRAKHPQESWRFIKYLCSRRGQERVCQTGLAIPVLRSVADSPCFSDPNQKPESDEVYLKAADVARVIEWAKDAKYRDQLKIGMEEIFKLGRPVRDVLPRIQRAWEANQNPTVFGKQYAAMPWERVSVWIVAPFLFVLLAGGAVWFLRRPARLAFREELAGLAMVSPWVIGFALFTAFPIVLTLLLAFTRWSALRTLDHAEFVGLDNFRELLGYDPTFHKALIVTTVYALLAVPTSQAAALLAALLMNQAVRGIAVFRAIWYLPSVLAGVGMAVMWKWVFHHEYGLLKALLDPVLGWVMELGRLLGQTWALSSPQWLARDADVWAVPAFVFINLWALGGTMMIYLAGLKGIPHELYEAANIDGAGTLRKFWNVTLPMLSPVIFFNVIMALIASFQVFTQAYVITGGGPGTSTHFYVFYLYKQAFDLNQMGYASAMAWLLLIIVLGLTLLVMRGSRRFVYYEALKA